MPKRSRNGRLAEILTIIIVATFAILNGQNAHASTSETLTLSPGWNILSTPRLLEFHSFSAPETSVNFDIFVLDASSTSGWSTMAEIGQTEFLPLYGYFVQNKTGANQTLTLNFRQNVAPADRLFERKLTKTGWYSIGPANPIYTKSRTGDGVDTNNVANVLYSLHGSHSDVVDFTLADYPTDPASVRVGEIWDAAVPVDLNSLNDLRETKGYAVYVTRANALYSGFQNINMGPAIRITTLPTPPDQTVTVGTTGLTVAKFELNPSVVNSGDDIMITRLIVSDVTTGLYSEFSNLALFDNSGKYLPTVSNTVDNGTTTVFTFANPIIVSSTASTTLTLKADVLSGVSSTHRFSATSAVAFGITLNDHAAVTYSGSGQTITLRGSTGAATIMGISGDNAAPTIDQNVIVGAVQVPVFAFMISAQNEPVNITSMTLTATGTIRSQNDLQNVSLYRNNESQPFASVSKMDLVNGKLTYTWSNPSNMLPSAVQPGVPVAIYVKADIGSGGQSIINDSFQFSIASGDVTGKGTASGVGVPISGYASVPALSYIAPFNVIASADAPTLDQTESVLTGTQIGRIRVFNNGIAKVTVSGINFTDTGSHTGTLTTLRLFYSDQNSDNYTGNVAVTSNQTTNFGGTGALFTLDAGAYRYVTVAIDSLGSSVSGDTYKLSLAKFGDLSYWVNETDIGYDATGEGILLNIVKGIRAEGVFALGTITKN